MNGETFSYYAPGWPAFLAIFRAPGLEWIANPLLTGAMTLALARSMQLLGIRTAIISVSLLAMVFSPFVLLNGASLYSHTATGALVMLLVWLQLSNESRDSAAKNAGIGALFSCLLNVRYEVFLIVVVSYVADRVFRRRLGFARDALWIGFGAVPLTAAFLGYNLLITGSPLLPPFTWANPYIHLGLYGFGDDGQHSPSRGLLHTFYWFGELIQYAGPGLLPLYAISLILKIRSGSVRFWDTLLVVTILFFVIQPDNGGHRYGPRYWFFAWPCVVLTIGSASSSHRDQRRMGVSCSQTVGCCVANIAFCTGALPVLMLATRLYIDARQSVYSTNPPAQPAVVLIPNRDYLGLPWQHAKVPMVAADFTRNGIAHSSPVLYGNGELPDAVALACELKGRRVFRWLAVNRYVEQNCP